MNDSTATTNTYNDDDNKYCCCYLYNPSEIIFASAKGEVS